MSPIVNFVQGLLKTSKGRYALIDSYRGFVFFCMFIYHSTLFTKQYGLSNSTIPSGLSWIIFQKFIAGSFFFLVGVGVFFGHAESTHVKKYFRRWGQIACCAIIVTITSTVLYPHKIITFGILHSIAVCNLLVLIFLRSKLTKLAVPVGIIIIVLGAYYRNSFFNHPLLQWTGLSTVVRPAFDHQPVFPWLGVSLLGLALAPCIDKLCKSVALPNNFVVTNISFLGQHTLFLYMAHVPVILGALELIHYYH